MKIYTRQGDRGETHLLGRTRVSKLDIRIVACGTIDELNASLGMAAALGLPERVASQISAIQSELFQIGAWIASRVDSNSDETPVSIPRLSSQAVERLEVEIDQMEQALPTLRHFILPGGHAAAAALQVSRAVCRRAEIKLLELRQLFDDDQFQVVGPWINRLGDWLFVAARCVNHEQGISEPIWKG